MHANALVEVWEKGEEGIGQIQFGLAGGSWQCHAWMCAPADSNANLERIAGTISEQLADGCEQGTVGDFTWQHVLSA